MKSSDSQSGFAHVLMVIIAVGLIGAVGFFAWQAFSKKAADTVADVASGQARAECEKENDKDLCRFITNWKVGQKYRMTSIESGNKAVFEVDGEKTHMLSGGEFAFEIISIGNTTYTKAGNVWYKQTVKNPEDDVTANAKVEFKEPADSKDDSTSKSKVVYKSLGKEPCGSLTCFKYEVVDPDNKETKEFIWFDDKDYLLRKTVSEYSDRKSEATYEYGNVTVKEPSPVKELAPNQYIAPGQTEPQTMPSAGDLTAQ